ncbi:hypothetical protein [Desulfogranum japonicum]|uniref:hypothetical protein n=1 Tax=Desulfogranum japonicum TaxID=231447 RepID=UPI0012947155|nr:hypothetical protein [Desulfogranum japonicum]
MNDPGFYRGLSASPVRVESLGEFGNFYYNFSLVILALISIYCFLNLWKKAFDVKTKIKWSIILLIPLLGPLFYGYSACDPPPKKRIYRKKG